MISQKENSENSFNIQNRKGEAFETFITKRLMSDGYTFKSTNKDSRYDLLMSKDDVDVTFECKCDMRMNETGNVFIETGTNRRINPKGKGKGKSGLYTSSADYYVIGDYNFYMMITKIKLFEAIDELQPQKRFYKHPTNPKKNNEAYIIKVDELKPFCEYIFINPN